MKRAIIYSLIFVLFFSISLLSSIPVSFALNYLPPVRGLTIEGTSGTVWQGSASTIRWQGQSFGEVHWDFQTSKLFTGNVQYAVRFGRGSDLNLRGKGLVGYGLGQGAYVENLVASLPAEKVASRLPMPLPLQVEGQVEVNVRHAVYQAPWCASGTGTLVWSASKVGTPIGALDLGPVISDFTCENSQLSVKGEQQSAQVSAQFSAQVTPNRQYTTSAWFKPGAEFPAAMKSQLSWLGNPNGQGQYEFDYQGRF
ncbi:type II secretion system protein N [Vibrio vulnificus]|uniref:type II secretion system protein N n=1 Tax=Vibrio vulnificus TaxID=672 RepID=UPI0007356A6B|nr:type II secretion system protein N [Vibrio vulnificus]EGR1425199.1 type II secretion system protein N [Vibrio vulnificus]EHU4945026.1 type II secretion system protein N [Vibrio vulnificus]MCU8259706.1 type II secretion system protein N [Vibrio vulnificus]MCU8421387.1 type II secretion system protein N [Vibrio vulnificus]PNM95437.1 type II secretion system protein N [Vibrio vulnificus]